MSEIGREIAAVLEAREKERQEAGQLAAFQIACHLDLSRALSEDTAGIARSILRLERMIERERQRGARGHWSYDLNRHIALKQALDRLRKAGALANAPAARQQREKQVHCEKKTAPGGAVST